MHKLRSIKLSHSTSSYNNRGSFGCQLRENTESSCKHSHDRNCVLIVDFSDISSGFLSHSAFFKKPWEYFNEMQFWVFTRSFYNPLFLHSSHALMHLLNRLDRYLSSWKVIFGFNFQTDDLILSSRKLLQCRIHSWISAILAVPEAMTKP